ncbi:MAG: 4'-phosphopantetheinyl transferase superfamily protein [Saprospiraceae bacterium]|nr:4'-phosphopantetheinyl transferase superfamily protein [Saprospiraceae bacterium]
MPIVKNVSLQNADVIIWHIVEDNDFFLNEMPWDDKQIVWIHSIHPDKMREYLASRYLIFKITGKLDSHLYKDEAGKLHLHDTNQHLSISHSGDWTGLAISNNIIGFDLQIYSNKIHKIAKRFLSSKEYQINLNSQVDENLIVSWAIKEAVYKAHGKKGIHFAEQIKLDLDTFNESQYRIQKASLISENEEKNYTIFHDWFENFGWAVAIQY